MPVPFKLEPFRLKYETVGYRLSLFFLARPLTGDVSDFGEMHYVMHTIRITIQAHH